MAGPKADIGHDLQLTCSPACPSSVHQICRRRVVGRRSQQVMIVILPVRNVATVFLASL
jgi:hypothetical protein